MSIKSAIKSVVSKITGQTQQQGQIFLRPSEAGTIRPNQIPGVNVQIPGGVPTTSGTGSSGASPTSQVKSGNIQQVISRGGGSSGGSSVGGNQLTLTREQALAQDQQAIQQRQSGPSQQQKQSVIQRQTLQPQTAQQLEDGIRPKFSGSVQELQNNVPQKKTFFVQGQETGRLNYDSSGKPVSAEVIKPSRFTFQQGNTKEDIQFTLTGIHSETLSEQDVSDEIAFGINQIIGGGTIVREGTTQEKIDYGFLGNLAQGFGERVSRSDFGKTKYGQKLVKNIGKTFDRDIDISDLTAFETNAGIKDIYKTTGIPGLVRSARNKGGVKLGTQISKLPYGEIYGSTAGKVIADVGLFGAFSPTFASTTSIEKELFQLQKVKLVGVSQRGGMTATGEQKILTQAGFNVQRGSQNVKGLINVKTIQQDQAFLSAGKGNTYKIMTEFPTARNIIKQGKEFKAVEIGGVTEKEGLSFIKSLGSTKTGKVTESYRSAGVSKQFSNKQGDFFAQVGATQSKKGGLSFNSGIFKVKDQQSPISFRATSSGARGNLDPLQLTTNTRNLRLASLQATKNIVGASVKIPVKTPLGRVLPVTSLTGNIISSYTPQATSQFYGTGLYERSSGGQVPFVNLRTNSVLNYKFSPISKSNQIYNFGQGQKERTRQIYSPLQIEETSQRFIQQQIPLLRQPQRQQFRQLQSFKQVFNQKQRNPTPSIFRINLRTTTPKIPLLYKSSRNSTTDPLGLFRVSIRRKGKFLPVGIGSFEKVWAKGLGLTQKELSQTFRIENLSGGGTPYRLPKGYYPKISKKQGLVYIEKPKSKINTTSEKGLLSQLSKQARQFKGYGKQIKGKRRKTYYEF